MLKVKTIAVNLILVFLVTLAAIRFCSEWNGIQKAACGDMRGTLHPSRRLMAGFEPNWHISPNFENCEFKDGFTPQGLREALERDGIVVPKARSEIAALNLLLTNDVIVRKLFGPVRPDFRSSIQWDSKMMGGDDRRRINRIVLETIYPLQCPRLQLKNDLKINQRPVLANDFVQSASPSFLVFFYPIYQFPLEIVKPFWFLFTWTLVLLSVYLLASCARWQGGPQIVWIVALFFIATSYSYNAHVFRGQKYIVYLFMLSASYYFLDRMKRETLSGFITGFLITFRPNVVFMLIPILFARRWKILMGVLAGIILGITLPVVIAGPGIWQSYRAQEIRARGLPASLATAHLSTAGCKFGNSFFDGAADDVRRSFLLKDPVPNCILSNFVHKRSAFNMFLQSSALFSNRNIWTSFLIVFLLSLVLIRYKTLKELFQRRRNARTVPDVVLFLIGAELFMLSNYFFCVVTYSYADV